MHKADVPFKREHSAKLELVQYLAESNWSHKIMFTNKNFQKNYLQHLLLPGKFS